MCRSRDLCHGTGRRGVPRRLVIVLCVAASVLAVTYLSVGSETSAQGEPHLVADSGQPGGRVDAWGDGVNVRSGPGTGHDIVGALPDGTQVTIYCVTPGESVTGPTNTSTWWDKISPDREEYVADALVNTGSVDPVTDRRCEKQRGMTTPLDSIGVVDTHKVPNPDEYPYANAELGTYDAYGNYVRTDDGHGYFIRECTSFVWWAVTHDVIYNATEPVGLGDAGDWGPNGGTALLTHEPKPGDVAWWARGADAYGDGTTPYVYGHVAYVAAVRDGKALLYEYNEDLQHNLRTDREVPVTVPTAFIRF